MSPSDPVEPTSPASTVAKAANRAGGLAHFAALQRKNLIQKKRAAVGCCVELLLPVIFILGLVGAWAASPSTKDIAATNYVQRNSSIVIDPAVLIGAAMCTNGSAIPTIRPCNASAIVRCADATLNIPMTLCLDAPLSLAAANFGTILYDFEFAARKTLSLDDFIKLKWFARLVRGIPSVLEQTAIYQSPWSSIIFGTKLFFTPASNETTALMAYLNLTSALFPYVNGGTFVHQGEAERVLTTREREGEAWAVINLRKLSTASIDVDIRVNRTAIPWTNSFREYYFNGLGSGLYKLYWTSGFTTLEDTLTQFWVNTTLGLARLPTPDHALMPTEKYKDGSFLILVGSLAPLVLVLAYLYSVSQLVKRIVEEKERRLREGMLIMGLHQAPFYLSWLTTYLVQMVFSSVVISIILKFTILQQTEITITLVAFLLFSFSTVTFASMLGSLFSKSRTAAVMAPLLFFAASIPTFAVDPEAATRDYLLAFSWLSPHAFGLVTTAMFRFEQTRGMGWADANSSATVVTLTEGLISLLCDTIGYFLIGLYLDAVLPSEWGTRRHPLFCFLACCKKQTTDEDDSAFAGDHLDDPLREKIATGHSPSVRIRGLRKEFAADGTMKAAVDSISLDLFPGDVTVLLGHNGAGKTTTINLMTGMLPLTAGDVEIYGLSVKRDMAAIRGDIGFCPQHNILWNELTVREHLAFYAAIKGITGAEQDEAVERMINDCDLRAFADVNAANLSGGNKRKLSVANAFMGGSRLVFLDEPTAGMDVVARRHCWGLIQKLSPGRTIILTTHYMDEADLLGNHIAIMNRGKIVCSGTPLFLKSHLGVGYSLNIALSAGTDPQPIIDVAKQHCEGADVSSAKGGELALRLPMQAVDSFPPLLEALESRAAEFGVRGFGISITTLEEVFLKMADHGHIDVPAKENPILTGAQPHAAVPIATDSDSLWPADVDTTCRIDRMQQFKGLLWKRLHNAKRDRRTLCLQIVTPLVLILIAMLLAAWKPPAADPMRMGPDQLKESHFDLVTDGCGSNGMLEPRYIERHPTVATPTPFNLSQWLLATHDAHTHYRDIAWQCPNQTLSRGATYFINATAFHSGGIGIAQFAESYLRRLTGNATLTLNFFNSMLPFTSREQDFIDGFVAVISGFFILIPFTFIPSTFVSWVVKERECKAKHLQNVSGVDFFAFWTSNLLFDFVSFTATQLLLLVILAIFNRTEYIGADAIGVMFLLFFLYGLAGVASSYFVHFPFHTHGTAQNVVMLINFIAGFLLVMLLYILSIIETTESAAKVIKFFARLIPSYCLGEGIITLATHPLVKSIGVDDPLWSMDNLGWPLLYLGIEFPLFFIGTLLLDHPARDRRRQQLFHNPDVLPPPIEDEDDDVARERAYVEEPASTADDHSRDLVCVRNLCKVYHAAHGPTVAVRNLSFVVKRGEIFAFLGTNGAGKTTTMSILTGEFLPTHGRCTIANHDVVDDAREARKVTGYCPQFDALLDQLTPKEHLELYAALRGVPPASVGKVVDHLLAVCALEEYRNIPAHQLSGGNKRKVSLAMALIGSPEVLFLDEPSAGMDPGTRRQVWAVIQRAAKSSSVVLTTHHLEEIEVLGDRVAIMVAGALKCIGPLQHLKNKFGSGFELIVKVVEKKDLSLATDFILAHVPGAKLSEQKRNRLTFALPRETKLSRVFATMRDQKENLCITDYSMSQTSLELVFLRIGEQAVEAEHEQVVSASPTTPPAERLAA